MGPGMFVRDEREHESHRSLYASAVGQAESPQVLARRGQNLADGRHRIQVEEAIAVGFRATQLERKAAVGCNLVRKKDRFIAFATVFDHRLIASELRKLRR